MIEFTAAESALLERYFTNLDRPVFALRNLPEVVKGALFSRYSRTEKSLRRVLLEEFIQSPETGFAELASVPAAADDLVAAARAEDFYERVLVGYGDDSVAELAGAHVAVEQVSMLGAKALEDSRIGISPLEKSTRYVRFDRPGPEGRFLYHRRPELGAAYEESCDRLFRTYSALLADILPAIRERYPIQPAESERAWKAATRAHAFDLLRGLLPASTLTNLGLFGNGRAFEYLVTKLSAHPLPECRELARTLHAELSLVIPSFLKRALDERYGAPAARRLERSAAELRALAPPADASAAEPGPSVRLLDFDDGAERRVAAAAIFPYSGAPLAELRERELDLQPLLQALAGERTNRRQKLPRALENARYTFEIVANFGAFRDLHRHRMLTQERQLLGTDLGYDVPPELEELGASAQFRDAAESAAALQARLAAGVGPELAQYAVPMAFRLRWYFQLNLRELAHLCELRTQPQGHPDYRWVAQEMFRRVEEVQPRLAALAGFVDRGPGEELERRAGEQRLDEKLRALGG